MNEAFTPTLHSHVQAIWLHLQAVLHLYRGSAMAPALTAPTAWTIATAAGTDDGGATALPGSSSGSSSRLHVDAACMLEVVEHLHPQVLE